VNGYRHGGCGGRTVERYAVRSAAAIIPITSFVHDRDVVVTVLNHRIDRRGDRFASRRGDHVAAHRRRDGRRRLPPLAVSDDAHEVGRGEDALQSVAVPDHDDRADAVIDQCSTCLPERRVATHRVDRGGHETPDEYVFHSVIRRHTA
jgi:hypothetical protein